MDNKKINRKIKKVNKAIPNFYPVYFSDKKIKISVWGSNNIDEPYKYIENLIDHIEGDIFPLLFTSGHAPFAVLRNIFCYIDHTARLRFGNKGSSGDLGKLFENFGAYPYIQKRYKEIYLDLVQLYRHELVHNVRPWPKIRKIKINDEVSEKQIGFFISSEINKKIFNRKTMSFINMKEFMKIEDNRKNLNHLRSTSDYSSFIVNNFCLLFDIVDYLDKYSEVLSNQNRNIQEIQQFCINYLDIVLENLKKPNTEMPLILDKKFATNTDINENEILDWYKKMRYFLYKDLCK